MTQAKIEREYEEVNAIRGLDVFSSDGLPVGVIRGYLDQVPVSELGAAEGAVDAIDSEGKVIGARRVRVDGHGSTMQATLAVPRDQLQIDWRGRRATLPLTLAQIRQAPRRRPDKGTLLPG